MTELKRLVIDFRTGDLTVRCLYRTEGESGPNTKGRWREEMRAAWCEYHQGQAARLRAVFEPLIARHEEQAVKLMEATHERSLG